MDRLSKLLLIPTAIATLAGFGMGQMTNVLQPYWPDAPHWVFAFLFWSGAALVVIPLPSWIIWVAWKNWELISGRLKVILGFVLLIGGCALGVVGLSLIAAGDTQTAVAIPSSSAAQAKSVATPEKPQPEGPISLLVMGGPNAHPFERNKIQIGRSNGRIEFRDVPAKDNDISIGELNVQNQRNLSQQTDDGVGIEFLRTSDVSKDDNGLTSDALVQISAPRKLLRIALAVVGPEITAFKLLTEESQPIENTATKSCGANCLAVYIENPMPRYVLRVTTRKPSQISINARYTLEARSDAK